jgi:hypothetical protein
MIALLGRFSARAMFQQPGACSQVLATSGMAPLDAYRELRQCYLVNEIKRVGVGRSWLCPCRGWFRSPLKYYYKDRT